MNILSLVLKGDLLRVLIHSLVHSCGFCESNEMLILQEEFLKKLKNKDTL
jgi:ssRNA-specific RNase YbeY (16S rRNA maturation enzyme)